LSNFADKSSDFPDAGVGYFQHKGPEFNLGMTKVAVKHIPIVIEQQRLS
jgi:hypothetical protein